MRNGRPRLPGSSAAPAVVLAFLIAACIAPRAAAQLQTQAPPTAESPPPPAETPPQAQARPLPSQEDGAGPSSRSQARAEERRRLFGALARIQTEAESRNLVREIWAFWLEPPDAGAGRLMDRAQERRRRYDRVGALRLLDQLVERAPEWAEGWNQRATLHFEMGRLDASLDDIEKVLAREPKHFGAMAGQAVILMRQGRHQTAYAVLERAIEVHPFLPERRYILPVDGPDQRL